MTKEEIQALELQKAELEVQNVRVHIELEKQRVESEIERNKAEAKHLDKHFTKTGGFYAAVASTLLTLVGLAFAFTTGLFDNSLKLHEANMEILEFEKARYAEKQTEYEKLNEELSKNQKAQKLAQKQLMESQKNHNFLKEELAKKRELQRIAEEQFLTELRDYEQKKNELDKQQALLNESVKEYSLALAELELSQTKLKQEKELFEKETGLWRAIAAIAHAEFRFNSVSDGDELMALLTSLPQEKRAPAISTVENWITNLEENESNIGGLDQAMDNYIGLIYILYSITGERSYWQRIKNIVSTKATSQNSAYFIDKLPSEESRELIAIILLNAVKLGTEWAALEGISSSYDGDQEALHEFMSPTLLNGFINYARTSIQTDESDVSYAFEALCRFAPHPCVAFLPEVLSYRGKPINVNQYALAYIDELRSKLMLKEDEDSAEFIAFKAAGVPVPLSFEEILTWIDSAPYEIKLWQQETWSNRDVVENYRP